MCDTRAGQALTARSGRRTVTRVRGRIGVCDEALPSAQGETPVPAEQMLAVRREQERRVLNSVSREDVGEFLVAADACPPARCAAVQPVPDQRVCAELEQCGDRFAPSRLRSDADRRDAFAMVWPAE